MKTLRPQWDLRHSNLSTPTANIPSFLIPAKAKSHFTFPTKKVSASQNHKNARIPRQRIIHVRNTSHFDKSNMLETFPKSQIFSLDRFLPVRSKGYSKIIFLGTISVALAIFLVGIDGQKALALGPGGPLMEDFWDNMRRYALYALTVSTGVIYTVFQPIVELLRNPISAILVLTLIGGSIFIVSQVVSAMVGLSDFAYDYSY